MRPVFDKAVGQVDVAKAVLGQEERLLLVFTQEPNMALVEDKANVPVIPSDHG